MPYGFVKNNKQIQFNLPSDFEESRYYKEVPFITNESPSVKNNLLNLLRNREDLKKWLLATSDYGNEIQEDLNAMVGYDEKFNNAIVRHALDRKDEAILRNLNPINVTFHNMKKFDLVNPVIGKSPSQVRASKLTKKLLEQGEIDKLQLRLDALKYGINKDDDDDEDGGTGSGGGRAGGDDRIPGPNLRETPQQEIDEITRRLNILRGNTPDVSPDNTREQNSRTIARQNQERFQNRQIRERERQIKNISKGIINKRKSSLNFNFRETPPYTPPRDNFSRYLQPTSSSTPNQDNFLRYLHPSSHFIKPQEPRETSFLFSDGTKPESLSPLRNKLKNIATLPSRPTIDNFARPITQMTDEKIIL